MFRTKKILYLAHYAPNQNGEYPICDKIHTVYAKYHKRIYEVLKRNFDTIFTSNDPEIIFNLPQNIDYIFSLYNRMPFKNSEIFISSVAEYHHIAYLGSTPNIRALAEDKHLSKMVAKYAGVPTPEWKVYNVGDLLEKPYFVGPYFIKPRFGAASKYVDENSICEDWNACINQILKLHENNQDVILEKFIDGTYYTSPVLNNFSEHIFLPCIEEKSILRGNVVTYHQKRKATGGLIRTVCSDDKINSKIHAYSKKIFALIQPLDYTRFDYIVDKNNVPYFLEFNVCCNLGEHSTLSQSANSIGYSYENTILNIVQSSMYRQNLTNDKSYKF